jgi:hypothetical protein
MENRKAETEDDGAAKSRNGFFHALKAPCVTRRDDEVTGIHQLCFSRGAVTMTRVACASFLSLSLSLPLPRSQE